MTRLVESFEEKLIPNFTAIWGTKRYLTLISIYVKNYINTEDHKRLYCIFHNSLNMCNGCFLRNFNMSLEKLTSLLRSKR